MQQPAWDPNATGSIATRSVTSILYFGGNSIHAAIIATLPPWTTGNEKGIRGRDDIKKRKGQDTFKDNEHCKKAG